jgi:hypothetical protein
MLESSDISTILIVRLVGIRTRMLSQIAELAIQLYRLSVLIWLRKQPTTIHTTTLTTKQMLPFASWYSD